MFQFLVKSTILTSLLTLSAFAHATPAPRSCLAMFNGSPAVETVKIKPGRKGEFDIEVFQAKVDEIEKAGKLETRAKTQEEKAAALIVTLRQMQARDVVNLEEWVKNAEPAEIAQMVKTVGRIDPKKGLGPKKTEDLFLKIVQITHQERATWRGLISNGFSDQKKRVLLSWARSEFAQKPFHEAFGRVVKVLDPGFRDVGSRYRQRFLNTQRVIGSIMINSLAMSLAGAHMSGVPIPVQAPQFVLLKRGLMKDSIREAIELKGIDAAYPEIEAMYGKRAGFQVAWKYARHIAMGAAIAYMITQVYPGVMTSLLDPNYIDPEKDSALEMARKVWNYYSRLALLYRWDELLEMVYPTKPKVTPAAPTGPAQTSIDQSPVLPPDANSQAATDTSLNADEPRTSSAATAPPEFDPAPDMPDDPPIADLPAAPGTAATSTEPGTRTLEF